VYWSAETDETKTLYTLMVFRITGIIACDSSLEYFTISAKEQAPGLLSKIQNHTRTH
jgi:hypothetical protein